MGQNSNKAIIATVRPSGHLAQHGPRRPREECIPLYADVYRCMQMYTKALNRLQRHTNVYVCMQLNKIDKNEKNDRKLWKILSFFTHPITTSFRV